ncbi:hypothetical protein BpHYR1_035434 [Brachionus plicatilis]|uniref:Uncharacterized protein n=1 Tax=Brachionus plicatilis TaxID=10195 RepID=A0A3M7QWV8_BRAPC|nr:hypothetical protein BpHYR1_035434 [Brachionus plicatilis]
MTDYMLQANWPSCPPATAPVTKTVYIWLQQISTAMSSVQTRIRILEEENRTQAVQISNLNTELTELKSAAATNVAATSSTMTFTSMVQNNGKKSEAEMVSFTKMALELKERKKIENNLIISGLEESTSESDEDKIKDDQVKVEHILEKLGVNKNKCKRIARMRQRRRTQENEEEQTTVARPALLIVELKDSESKQTILARSRDLGKITEFRNVYINQDRKISERAYDRCLRETKKQRNSTLEHEETVNVITLKYKMENGKRWFWGIRNGNVVWVLHKDDRDI